MEKGPNQAVLQNQGVPFPYIFRQQQPCKHLIPSPANNGQSYYAFKKLFAALELQIMQSQGHIIAIDIQDTWLKDCTISIYQK